MDTQKDYDVFKGTPDNKPLWLGAINGLERAITQMNQMAERLPGDYFVYDTSNNEVKATVRRMEDGPSGAQSKKVKGHHA